ncbi:MAG: class I tRNA ligase family protein, partial [Anaerolineales bacterium]|nr:class I tRNA ligase family protein [Anaerolineales bacterium]
LQQVIAEVTAALDDYQIYKATAPVEAFLDDLSNWYVRRSRRRFWKSVSVSDSDADKQAAYSTLYQVLVTLTKLLAPMVPFATEQMYQNLVRAVDASAPESVHHCAWPEVDEALVDETLLAEMSAARMVVTLGHAVRAAGSLKVRQPLGRVVVVAPPAQRERLSHMRALITDELNVKALEFAADEAELVTYKLMPDNRALGPKFGPLFPKVRAALTDANPQAAVNILRSGQKLALDVDGQLAELTAGDVIITPQPKPGFAVRAEGEYVVALDTAVTPALRAEGLAREFVRRVQDLRKSAGFDIADRIATYFIASPGLAAAVMTHAEYIQAETLSVALSAGGGPDGAATAEDAFDGEKVRVVIVKAKPAAKKATKAKAKPAAKKATKAKPATKKAAKPKTKPAAKKATKPATKKATKAKAKPAAKKAAKKATKPATKKAAKPKTKPAPKPRAKAKAKPKPRSAK